MVRERMVDADPGLVLALTLVPALFGCSTAGAPPPSDAVRRLGVARVGPDEATFVVDLHSPSPLSIAVRFAGEPEWIETESPVASRHHEVLVLGLDPASRHEYRVNVGGALFTEDDLGRPLAFETPDVVGAPGERSCALLIADTQGGRFFEALDELPGVDAQYILSLGDQVGIEDAEPTPQGRESHYLDYLLGPLSVLTAHMPLMTVVGNHDAANASEMMSRDVALDLYTTYLALPDNGPATSLGETVYSFDWNAVHVAVLDSTGPTAMRERGYLDEEQLSWLSADMGGVSDARWRIVALHHMVYGWESPDEPPQADWFHLDNFERAHEAFLAAGVDLVLSGHRHAYNVFVRDGMTYVTVPTLSRDKVLFDRYGPADWTNDNGEEGTLASAVSDVFGHATLCAESDLLEVETTLYDANRDGLVPVPVEILALTR